MPFQQVRQGRGVLTRWFGKANKKESVKDPGRGAAWLARLLGVQEVVGSNPVAPIDGSLCSVFLYDKTRMGLGQLSWKQSGSN